MNNKQKRARFRELAKHDRIRTGRQLPEELEQPFLPLINDCLTDVQRRKAARFFAPVARRAGAAV
jgi:hypothetical protein